MSPQLEDIVRKVRSDERIAPAEALVLWHEAPLWLLGELAARRKERVSGDYKSIGTKTVTLKAGDTSVSDEGEGHKFVLETGKVYKMVVNGVESNDIKGA